MEVPVKINPFGLILLGLVLVAPSLQGQGPPPADVRSLVRSSLPARRSDGTYKLPPTAMIKNRARVLGDETTASGKRYFAVTDQDIAGKSPAEVLNLLQPAPVKAGDGARSIYVLVDVAQNRPVTVTGGPGEPVNVGTVVAQGRGLRHIDVETIVRAPGLTVVGR
jgi:hypothetical protein